MSIAGEIIRSLNCAFHLTMRNLKKYKLAKLYSLGNNNKNLVNRYASRNELWFNFNKMLCSC